MSDTGAGDPDGDGTTRRPPAAARRLVSSLSEQKARIESLCTGVTALSGDALHDVRVALRRVTAIARLLRGFPGEPDGRALPGIARDLRKALSPSRSHEVCRARLVRRFPRDASRRTAARSIAAAMAPSADETPPTAPRILAVLGPVLEARLEAVSRAAEAAGSEEERRFRKRLGRRLRRIRDRLLALGVPERAGIHRFRIQTKHLRYALEPFEAEIAGAPDLLRSLRRMQDAAGDAHDREEVVAILRDAARAAPARRSAARLLLPVFERDAVLAAGRTQRLARRVLAETAALRPRIR